MNNSIELRYLKYFVAVAEDLHFGNAARRLYIAQPALSQQIQKFEQLLGCALLMRTSRAVRLTAAGEAMLERARRMLQRMEDDIEFVRRVGRGESGSLRVGFIGSGMLTELPAFLGEYRRLYRDVELRLQEFYTSNLIQAIQDGSIDVGFVRDSGVPNDLSIEPFLKEKFIAVVPKRHRLASQKTIRIAQLRDEPFVFYSRSAGPAAWDRTMDLCKACGFEAKVVQEAPHWVTIVSLVGAGLGISIAPQCIRKIAGESVACLPIASQGTTCVELAYRRDEDSPVVKEFCQLVRTLMKRKPRV